jgi:hypothetical protein
MTSKQAMLTLSGAGARTAFVFLMLFAMGCSNQQTAERLNSPYQSRRVWAVTPFANESGSAFADSFTLADQFVRQLDTTPGIDVLPLNRTLAAMEAMKLRGVSSQAEAMGLMKSLGVDGLIVGTVSAFDPYDPPKLGVAIELYTSERMERQDLLDVRDLSTAATPPNEIRFANFRTPSQPVSIVSDVFDAKDPNVTRLLKRFATDRGSDGETSDESWHRYRISMDLYSEFVSYVVSWRLLRAESDRLTNLSGHSNENEKASAP